MQLCCLDTYPAAVSQFYIRGHITYIPCSHGIHKGKKPFHLKKKKVGKTVHAMINMVRQQNPLFSEEEQLTSTPLTCAWVVTISQHPDAREYEAFYLVFFVAWRRRGAERKRNRCLMAVYKYTPVAQVRVFFFFSSPVFVGPLVFLVLPSYGGACLFLCVYNLTCPDMAGWLWYSGYISLVTPIRAWVLCSSRDELITPCTRRLSPNFACSRWALSLWHSEFSIFSIFAVITIVIYST